MVYRTLLIVVGMQYGALGAPHPQPNDKNQKLSSFRVEFTLLASQSQRQNLYIQLFMRLPWMLHGLP